MLAASSPGHLCWRSCKRTKEAKRRQLKATFTVTSTGTFTAQARKSSVFLLLNLIRKTLTRACVLETGVHISIGYTIARSGIRAHNPRVIVYTRGEAEGYMRTSGL